MVFNSVLVEFKDGEFQLKVSTSFCQAISLTDSQLKLWPAWEMSV